VCTFEVAVGGGVRQQHRDNALDVSNTLIDNWRAADVEPSRSRPVIQWLIRIPHAKLLLVLLHAARDRPYH